MTHLMRIPLFSTVLLFTSTIACEPSALNWPEVTKCGPDSSDLIGVVSEVLLGEGTAQTELENLARTNGTDTVACLVDKLRSGWLTPGAASTPQRVSAVEKAGKFLSAVGTE